MEDETLYMFRVEGVDANGDPVRAVVPAVGEVSAKAKVRADYQGRVKYLKAERISGYEWDALLKGYGSQYGPFSPYDRPERFAHEVSRWGITESRPVFI